MKAYDTSNLGNCSLCACLLPGEGGWWYCDYCRARFHTACERYTPVVDVFDADGDDTIMFQCRECRCSGM